MMRRTIARHMVFALAAIMSAWLMLSGLHERSPTEDEWAHLVRGLQYWHGDDTRLQYAHPPLANALTAAPLALDDEIPDFTTFEGWEPATVGRVAREFLRLDYSRARLELMWARMASVALALLGMTYAYFWGSSVLGRREGLLLALVLAFHPTVIGHARYVSTDLACAVFCFVAVGELTRHAKGNAPWATWVGVPVGLSFAVLSKHSALLLIPIFVVGTLLTAALGRGRHANSPLWRRLGGRAAYSLFNAFVLVVALNVAYGFQRAGMSVAEILAAPEPQYWISKPHGDRMLEGHSVLASLPPWLRIPVPYTWLFGVSAVRLQSAHGYPWASFMGMANPRGHSGFFPTLVLLKTPIAYLFGISIAVITAWRRRTLPMSAVIVAAVASGFLLVAMSSRLNMGVRHVLPVLYLSAVWVALGLSALWDAARSARARVMLLLLGASSLLAPAFIHRADYLGYFNIGRALGHRVSVVGEDVGQDRFRFARWADEHRIAPLFYDSQTSVRALEARWAGLRFFELQCSTRIPEGAYAAVHASRRIAVGPNCMPQLDGLEPFVSFNDHIDVYEIPRTSRSRLFHAEALVSAGK